MCIAVRLSKPDGEIVPLLINVSSMTQHGRDSNWVGGRHRYIVKRLCDATKYIVRSQGNSIHIFFASKSLHALH